VRQGGLPVAPQRRGAAVKGERIRLAHAVAIVGQLRGFDPPGPLLEELLQRGSGGTGAQVRVLGAQVRLG
jgi:hypothetical protein